MQTKGKGTELGCKGEGEEQIKEQIIVKQGGAPCQLSAQAKHALFVFPKTYKIVP